MQICSEVLEKLQHHSSTEENHLLKQPRKKKLHVLCFYQCHNKYSKRFQDLVLVIIHCKAVD